MMKFPLRVLAFIPVLALLTVSASAGCHVIGHKNGEDICETTSDGEGHPFVVSPTKTKTIGDIQVTTSATAHASSSRVRVRSPDAVRREHNWH